MGSLSEEVRTEVLCGRICDLEAENSKLRERIHELEIEGSDHFYRAAYAEDANRTLEVENAKLRELVFDMLVDEERGHNDENTFDEHARAAKEFGIEL